MVQSGKNRSPPLESERLHNENSFIVKTFYYNTTDDTEVYVICDSVSKIYYMLYNEHEILVCVNILELDTLLTFHNRAKKKRLNIPSKYEIIK